MDSLSTNVIGSTIAPLESGEVTDPKSEKNVNSVGPIGPSITSLIAGCSELPVLLVAQDAVKSLIRESGLFIQNTDTKKTLGKDIVLL